MLLWLFTLCSALKQIKEQNPKLGKSSQVLKVSMDKVYDFTTGLENRPGKTMVFRFMPDMEQVRKAIQVRTASWEADMCSMMKAIHS
jgi:hypothetical protein